jgi:hypothetical protein
MTLLYLFCCALPLYCSERHILETINRGKSLLMFVYIDIQQSWGLCWNQDEIVIQSALPLRLAKVHDITKSRI